MSAFVAKKNLTHSVPVLGGKDKRRISKPWPGLSIDPASRRIRRSKLPSCAAMASGVRLKLSLSSGYALASKNNFTNSMFP